MEDTLEYSYEPFSREPEYLDLNREFIDALPLDRRTEVLDLACGTGTLTTLLLDRLRRTATAKPRIVGLDLSGVGLGLAREYVEHCGPYATTPGWVRASADTLPLAPNSFDAVVMGNAIQMLEDKAALIAEVARVLRPGGLFAFNTSFYSGTYLPETERFYIRWVQEALTYILNRNEELQRSGQRAIRRVKGSRPAYSNPWLSPSEYQDLLKKQGFQVSAVAERTVMLRQSSFETIGSYAGLATVLLSGYPVEIACEALVKSAGPALAAERLEVVPRHWIEIVALRSGDAYAQTA